MTGFIGAAWLFHDHEIRIRNLENWHAEHDRSDKNSFADYESFKGIVKEKLNIK
jgi:hypothetical protein